MEQDDKINQFVLVTGADPAQAAQYLEFSAGSLEQAIDLFLDRPDLASNRANGTGDDDEAAIAAAVAEMADEPVRAPDARRTNVLVGSDYASAAPTVQATTNHWARGSVSRLATLYGLPEPLRITRDLDSAKELGRRKQKPILVDMQVPSIFDCSCLIRDIWNNRAVLEYVTDNFVFVQYTQQDGMWETFRSLYMSHLIPIGDDAYPYVAVIDSITGELIHQWVGRDAFPAPKPPSKSAMDPVAFRDRLESVYVASFGRNHFAGLDGPSRGAELVVLSDDEDEMTGVDDDEDDEGDGGGGVSVRGLNRDDENEGGVDGLSAHLVDVVPTSTFDAIEADDTPQPAAGPDVTRIRFRFPDGRQTIRRFDRTDPVRRLYGWLKANPPDDSFVGREFQLVVERQDLLSRLGESIADAGLLLAAVQVELCGDAEA